MDFCDLRDYTSRRIPPPPSRRLVHAEKFQLKNRKLRGLLLFVRLYSIDSSAFSLEWKFDPPLFFAGRSTNSKEKDKSGGQKGRKRRTAKRKRLPSYLEPGRRLGSEAFPPRGVP